MDKTKKREFKPLFNEDLLGENPFVRSLVVQVSQIEYKSQFKKDKDGDLLPVIGELEYEKICKVIVSPERRLKTNKLSPRAKELLLWLLYEADTNKDYLWINRVRYMNENNISSLTTYRSAVNELITNCFIVRSVVNAVYWINPDLFFNGNRINKFKDNIKFRL